MASVNKVVPGDELSAETILALLEEAEIPGQPGPGETDNVMVDMGGIPFLIDAYPGQQAFKVWTARELDHEKIQLETALRSANSFNETFLFVRNFVYQDPGDPANFRVVWDHDSLVGPEGLTSEQLKTVLLKVADVLLQAFSPAEDEGHA